MATMIEGYSRVPLATVDQNDIRSLVGWTYGNQLAIPTLDSQNNRFFRRELEFILPELVDFNYGVISARNLFPIDNRGGPGAETITWRQRTKVGKAKTIGDYADDIPKANVFSEEFTSRVRSIACEATWSIQEIRAAAMANVQLEREEAEAAREAILRRENEIAWSGSAKDGLVGVIDTPNVPSTTAPNGVWSGLTGAQMVADLNLLVNKPFEDTNQDERVNTVLLPTEQYHLTINTRMETGTDTTVLQFFINNSPYVNSMDDVIPVNELKGAGPAGVDLAIAYNRNPSKITMDIPFDIESLAPEVRGLTTNVIYHERFAGIKVKKPLSLHKLTGI